MVGTGRGAGVAVAVLEVDWFEEIGGELEFDAPDDMVLAPEGAAGSVSILLTDTVIEGLGFELGLGLNDLCDDPDVALERGEGLRVTGSKRSSYDCGTEWCMDGIATVPLRTRSNRNKESFTEF